MKSVYTITIDTLHTPIRPEDITPGAMFVLYSRENVLTNVETFHVIPDNGEGIGGNMDPHIRRYHGWRGTSSNISVTALGLRRVIEVKSPAVYDDFRGTCTMRVKFGPDEASDRP